MTTELRTPTSWQQHRDTITIAMSDLQTIIAKPTLADQHYEVTSHQQTRIASPTSRIVTSSHRNHNVAQQNCELTSHNQNQAIRIGQPQLQTTTSQTRIMMSKLGKPNSSRKVRASSSCKPDSSLKVGDQSNLKPQSQIATSMLPTRFANQIHISITSPTSWFANHNYQTRIETSMLARASQPQSSKSPGQGNSNLKHQPELRIPRSPNL